MVTKVKKPIAVAILVLGGATIWWAATRDGAEPHVSANVAAVAKIRARSGDLSKEEFVAALATQNTQEATDELVKSYVAWAAKPEALGAREAIIDSLYRIESVPRRLKAVLDAIAGDKTPVRDDPLWNRAVDKLARTFADDPSRLQQEQDVMLAEKRARAKELMATAMSQFAQSSPGAPSQAAKDLPEGQRAGVCQDLIDVYFESGSESYRRDLEGGIQALCGNDALIVLKKTANGIGPHELDVLVQRDQAMQQAIDHLGKGESVVPAGDPKKH